MRWLLVIKTVPITGFIESGFTISKLVQMFGGLFVSAIKVAAPVMIIMGNGCSSLRISCQVDAAVEHIFNYISIEDCCWVFDFSHAIPFYHTFNGIFIKFAS